MKILQVTLGYLPALAWGGPVKIVQHNALELKRRGHQISICTSNLLNKHTKIQAGSFTRVLDEIPIHYLNTYLIPNWHGTTGPTLLSPGACVRLWREVKSADLVHINGLRNIISLLAVVFARLQHRPIVIQPHGTIPPIISSVKLKKFIDWLFMKRLINSANALIAGQNSEKNQIVEAGGDQRLIHIVPNGLPVDFNPETYRGQFRLRYGIPNNRRVILFLARVNRKKGPDILVEAFARLPEEVRESTQLVIAGPDDGYLPHVKSLIKKYGLANRVLIPGLLSGDEVWSALTDADIFVLPCRTDTFPMAVIEACRVGTPIIATETCEIADLISGRAATVVPLDVAVLANAIADLLLDDELSEQYRIGGQNLVETSFSIKAVGDQLEHIYSNVLTNNNRSAHAETSP